MAEIEFDWVDAFSSQAFRGNGCAVVYFAENWSLEDRLRYVRETGLSECTFLSRDGAAWRVQYYLAGREIPYAGHPTIASAWSLFDRGWIEADTTLLTGVGEVPVHIEDGWVTISAPIPELGAEFARKEIAEIYGIDASDIVRPPQYVAKGLGFFVTELRNQDVMDRAALNVSALEGFLLRHGVEDFVEPYLVTFEHEFRDQALSLGRLLLPPPNPAEDAFTGSATGMFAAWGFAHGLVPEAFTHAQGHRLGRLGFAKVLLRDAGKSLISVRISGQGYILMRGHIT